MEVVPVWAPHTRPRAGRSGTRDSGHDRQGRSGARRPARRAALGRGPGGRGGSGGGGQVAAAAGRRDGKGQHADRRCLIRPGDEPSGVAHGVDARCRPDASATGPEAAVRRWSVAVCRTVHAREAPTPGPAGRSETEPGPGAARGPAQGVLNTVPLLQHDGRRPGFRTPALSRPQRGGAGAAARTSGQTACTLSRGSPGPRGLTARVVARVGPRRIHARPRLDRRQPIACARAGAPPGTLPRSRPATPPSPPDDAPKDSGADAVGVTGRGSLRGQPVAGWAPARGAAVGRHMASDRGVAPP